MDKIAVLDFGGQYCHLIARRIRDLGVLAEVYPSDIKASCLALDSNIRGIILSGGARSVYDKNAPPFDKELLAVPLPFLGICYGHQLLAHLLGGEVVSGTHGEYGITSCEVKLSEIFLGLDRKNSVWMNHRDVVASLPPSCSITAVTEKSAVAAFMHNRLAIFSVQFHPEVSHTKNGDKIFKNFIFGICECKKEYSSRLVIDDIIQEAKETIGNKKTIIGLSGGVDSSVAAMLVAKAIGKNLTAVYIDTGLMREGETEFIENNFRNVGLHLRIVHAGGQFFEALRGITDSEKKRKTIGALFANIFQKITKDEDVKIFVQGTIYSDRIESGITKYSSKIKSHHNVGGLPKNFKMQLYEPLRDLYKDEVRKIARKINLPKEIISRQVFPGPGLAIRIIGEVTRTKTHVVRHACKIIEEELYGTKFWKKIWMSFAILLPIKSVGIQGDERSYKYPVVVRIVESRDAMTANFAKLPYAMLEKISSRITNEIKEINRVAYDITHKPPATMEWE